MQALNLRLTLRDNLGHEMTQCSQEGTSAGRLLPRSSTSRWPQAHTNCDIGRRDLFLHRSARDPRGTSAPGRALMMMHGGRGGLASVEEEKQVGVLGPTEGAVALKNTAYRRGSLHRSTAMLHLLLPLRGSVLRPPSSMPRILGQPLLDASVSTICSTQSEIDSRQGYGRWSRARRCTRCPAVAEAEQDLQLRLGKINTMR